MGPRLGQFYHKYSVLYMEVTYTIVVEKDIAATTKHLYQIGQFFGFSRSDILQVISYRGSRYRPGSSEHDIVVVHLSSMGKVCINERIHFQTLECLPFLMKVPEPSGVQTNGIPRSRDTRFRGANLGRSRECLKIYFVPSGDSE